MSNGGFGNREFDGDVDLRKERVGRVGNFDSHVVQAGDAAGVRPERRMAWLFERTCEHALPCGHLAHQGLPHATARSDDTDTDGSGHEAALRRAAARNLAIVG